MAWRRNLQVSSVGTSAERLGVGADHDGGRAAGAKGAATEETRKGLRLRILPGTGCHRAGPPSKSGARAGGGRSDDFTQSNCGGTEAELATSATTCLHPQPPSRAYICVRNHFVYTGSGVAHLGGTIVNAEEAVPGEIRGTGVTGARKHELGPGDIVLIPRNTAHYVVPTSEKLGYNLVKVWGQ